jgi:hypothetical protein
LVAYVARGADEFGVTSCDGGVSAFPFVECFWIPNVGYVGVVTARALALPGDVFTVIVEDEA